jgi:hypothetical protein
LLVARVPVLLAAFGAVAGVVVFRTDVVVGTFARVG